ncbi:MAG: hypothetical protein FJX39_02705 [Alphaproteobacteria bacterium]|nr:hypothetical protein [Alphaproteobacteria bacterium]
MSYNSNATSNYASIRRQFKVSLALIVAIALAAFILGFCLPVSSHVTVVDNQQETLFIGRLVDLNQ